MKMHTDDQKYGFMREWMMNFSGSTMSLDNHWEWGVRAWKMLQEMPEAPDEDNGDLFKHSPK